MLAAAAAEPVTYSKDIAPLIADRCAMCHHPGGSGPFNLLSYDDVKRRAALIAAVTERRYMPPWKADPSNGPFVDQHPLSDEEIRLIRRWVDEGSVEGDSGAARAGADVDRRLAARSAGRRHHAAAGVHAAAGRHRCVSNLRAADPDIGAFDSCAALEFRPGNPKVVHHANIRIDKTPASRALDEAQPGPGYDGLIAHSAQYPDGHFLGWTPGQVAPLLPKDLAWRLDVHSDLVVELHMQPSGKPESVAPSVGLYFSDAAPTRTPAMLRLGRQSIDIPAGQRRVHDHRFVRAAGRRGRAGACSRTRTIARATCGARRRCRTAPIRPLIGIKDWDFRWQHVYRFATPLHFPKGTRLSMRYTYDNSAANPRNPRSAAEAGAVGTALVGRDGRSLDPGADARTPASSIGWSAISGRRSLAEDVIGYERGDREASRATPACTTMRPC